MRFNNILKPPHIKEGYKIMPPMDKEKYPEMPGLEGPFTMMSGKVVYYDPKEGAYYDKDTDMYMSYDEFQQHDNDYSNMKDERDEVKSENVAVRRDGKTLSKGEIAKLQRQGVLMKEGDYDQDTVKKNALEALVDIAKTAKKYKGGVTDEQIEILGGLIQDMDLAGIEPEKYSAVNELFKVMATDKKADMTMIQPAYAQVKKIDEDINEGEEKPYICVHAKKGKHECRAESSYAAAKKAAEHWGLKSTSGIDAYLAVDEGAPQSSPRPKPRPKRIPRPKPRPTTNIGSDPVTGSTRGIDPKDNYSPEDLKRLLMQSAMEDMKEDDEDEDDDLFKDDEFTAMDQEDDDEVNKHFDRMRELGMIVYVGDQKFEYADYTIEDAMRIVDEYADEMEGEPYEVYNADGKLVASGTMRSGAFHEPGIEEGHSPHKKGTKKYKAHMAAMHANEDKKSKRRVSMNQVCEAVKQTDPTQAVAMYVRTTLDPSYKTWDQVHEQVKHILSCINEGKTVNANTVMQLLSRKNLQEKADKGMMLKENIDSLRKIVRDKQYQTIKFSDGSMKVDLTTASMFIQVYEKQKPETQAKMDKMLLKKSGFLKLLDVMYSKMS